MIAVILGVKPAYAKMVPQIVKAPDVLNLSAEHARAPRLTVKRRNDTTRLESI